MLCARLYLRGKGRGLQLSAEACNGEAQLLPVLSHRTASDGIASLGEELGELLIGEWLTLIFLSNQLRQGFTYLTCGDALAFFVEDTFSKEELQHIDSVVRLHGLAVAYP